jgi:tetratricopeptide (TPR) repeat protein
MLSAGEAAAWAGDLQLRVGLLSQGAARIESAAAAAPDAAKAQLALASLRLRQHRVDEALPLFERAVVLTPEDFSAQFALGVSLLRREVIGGRFGGNTPAVARARAALAKAAELNAASSEAFAWLAYAEMVTDGRLAAAMTAIRRAIDLAPGRLDYVLRFADICILGGALPEARKVLTDVSHVTTDPDAVEGAARRLEVLREREAQERAADGARSAATAAAAGETVSPDGGAKPSNAATIELELEPEPERARLTAENFRLRKVQRGEERAYGELTELECDAAQVRFHLRVGSRIIIATAKRMEDITLTEFVGNKDFAVACGKRDPADTVFLTWRAAPLRAEAAATIVGEAVALEIVPRGFTP